MVSTIISLLTNPIGFIGEWRRVNRPSFAEARARLQWMGVTTSPSSPRRSRPLLAEHVSEALGYVTATTESLDRPDFEAALKRFYEWSGRLGSERGALKAQVTLQRWMREQARDVVAAEPSPNLGVSGVC